VELSFANAQLAALCNSKRQLISRWGAEGFAAVSRRLCELAAVDAEDIAELPGASIIPNGTGVTIDFGTDELTLNAIPLDGKEPVDDLQNASGICLVNLEFGGGRS
jgi:hypothetical protein